MRHVTTFAIFGLLAGCAAHTSDPVPPSSPEKDPSAYPSGSTSPGGSVSTPDQTGTPSSGSSGQPKAPSTPPSDSPTQVITGAATAAIDTNLDRLKALQIFEVGGLLLTNLPAEANCYGLPCPGKEQAYADAREAQGQRLADFTDTTVKAAALPVSYDVVTPALSEQNLEALRGLNVVGIGALILAKPVISGNCYGACPEEVALCSAINAERANKLANIAKAF